VSTTTSKHQNLIGGDWVDASSGETMEVLNPSTGEVIVTTFTAGAQSTLPIYILSNIQRGQQLPIVNAVVFVVIALTIIPVVISQRLTQDSGLLRRR